MSSRQETINEGVSTAVIAALKGGMAEIHSGMAIKNISCAEAVEALRHTIEVVEQRIPLDFK